MALDTVRNLLNSSLLLARAVNKGEIPDADEYTDAFDSLIAMLGSWETESLISDDVVGYTSWTLDTLLATLAPGMIQAIRYNLSLLISDEYGKSPSATVLKEAIRSKGVVKSSNLVALNAVFNPELPGMRPRYYNWFNDNANGDDAQWSEEQW